MYTMVCHHTTWHNLACHAFSVCVMLCTIALSPVNVACDIQHIKMEIMYGIYCCILSCSQLYKGVKHF